MAAFDLVYQDLLRSILQQGGRRHDRTQVGTLSLFGRSFELNLNDGFPLITLRHLSFRIVLTELLWMLKGMTDTQWLVDRHVRIWQPWATSEGQLGPVTGTQWRAWPAPDGTYRDQVVNLLDGLRKRPHSRRHLLNAWNVAALPDEDVSPQGNVQRGRMALAPCLVTQQFYVDEHGLSMMVHQRSADAVLGLPYDVAGSALMLHMFARTLGLQPHRLVMALGDVHLYSNHLEQAHELICRHARSAPSLAFVGPTKLPFDYAEGDIVVQNYDPHPALTAPVAV